MSINLYKKRIYFFKKLIVIINIQVRKTAMSLRNSLLTKLTSDGYFKLNNMELVMLIEKYDYKLIINEILSIFRDNKIPFPYAHYFINDEKLQDKFDKLINFKDKWKNDKYCVNTQDQPKTPFSLRYTDDLTHTDYNLYQPNDHDYHQIDNITCYFTDISRMSSYRYIKGIVTKSPQNGWEEYDDYVRDAIENALKSGLGINAHTLREGLYYSQKRKGCPYTECAHERLCFLKMVFDKIIDTSTPLRIFDACAGWGDRLILAMALNADKYVGIEPNSKSSEGFSNAIKRFGDSAKHMVLCDGCPNPQLPSDCDDNSFTLAFLSPPAFDSEFYSLDPKQSISAFDNFDDWMIGFLLPTIDLCWNKLAIGGKLVIQSLLAAKINVYIQAFCKGSVYLGPLTIITGRNRNKPLWVWQKKTIKHSIRYDIENLESELSRKVLDYITHV